MPSLILLVEGCDRQVYPLGRATLMVGRDTASDLQLPSTSISPNHASIIFEKGEFVLRDNGSPNGSFVNGEPVKRRILQHHDLIRFGEYSFLVDLEDDHLIPASEEDKQRELEKEGKPTEYVPAAKANRKYSEVFQISNPKSSPKLPAITGAGAAAAAASSPAMEIRVTEPVKYTRVTAIPKAAPVGAGGVDGSGDTKWWQIPVYALILISSIFLTLYLLPFQAREIIVESDGFKKIPLSGTLGSLLIQKKEGNSLTDVYLEQGKPFGNMMKITIPRTTRLEGNLRFTRKTAGPMKLKALLRDEKQDKVIMEKTLEIPSETESIQLFSQIVNPGIYSLQGICEEGVFVGEATGSLKINTYY